MTPNFFTFNIADLLELAIILVGGLITYFTVIASLRADLKLLAARIDLLETHIELLTRQDVLGPQLVQIRLDLTGIKNDLRSEVTETKANLRSDLAELKADVRALSAAHAGCKTED